MADTLDTYHRKRRFDDTPEPSGRETRRGKGAHAARHRLAYVIQEHHARRLHYDFRLELDGTLKSWAIPKGPSVDPSVKRLAVHVEDHPLDYGSFEGEIPEGNYGAGTVRVWDRGTWEPAGGVDEARRAYRAGKLKFRLDGDKLHGGWALVRSSMRGSGDKEQWLLIKERDDEARSEAEFDVLEALPGSVMDGGASKGGAKRSRTSTAKTEKPLKQGAKRRESAKRAAKKTDIVANRTTTSLRELAASPAIDGARKAALPARLAPQLATLVDAPPAGDAWAYEIKFDGYRVLVRIDRQPKRPSKRMAQRVALHTRAGHDWTAKFSRQAKALDALDVDSAWLDGEAVVLDADGVPSFQLLQNAFDANRSQDIVLYFFDIPYLNGYDLRDVPLVQRRAILRALMEPLEGPAADMLRFSGDFGFTAEALLKSACDMALEGIIGKRIDGVYRSGRSSSWIKLKCRRRQEFVIGGYSEPTGSRSGFGALLLGVYDTKGKLHYAGRVGTGFDAALLRSVRRELDARATSRMPFAEAPRERSRTPVHWVKPELVAECNFAEWTDERIVRQASFVSLRRDKPARQIVREAPRKGADVQRETSVDERAGEGGDGAHARARAKKASGGAVKQPAAASHENGARADEAGADDATKPVRKKAAAKRAPAKASAQATTKNPTKAPAKTTTRRSANPTTTVAGVRISHPDRVIDRSTGTSKLDLVRYYASVADRMLPHLQDRPVALVRAPDDIGGELFFQKHSQKLAIPHVTQHPGLDPGHPPLITIDSVDALVGAAQMGTVELHTWNGVASNLEKPDRVVFDLDPDPALGWERMIEAAQLTRSLLDELGLASFCKTSGGKGLHVVVPLAKHAGWDDVKAFSQAIAQHMAATLPDHFSAKMGAQNRRRKIFVDYLRNNRGSSTVAAFSARARPGLGVSVPLAWDEVAETRGGDQWNIANLHERLDALKRDPWAGYAKTRQRITAEMRKRLGMKP